MAMHRYDPFCFSNPAQSRTNRNRRRLRGVCMYVSGHFRVTNYKSYRDSGKVKFKPGFNILTGQNSAGKTALLEALTFQFPPNPFTWAPIQCLRLG